jgi:hypothetical protein
MPHSLSQRSLRVPAAAVTLGACLLVPFRAVRLHRPENQLLKNVGEGQ